MNGYTIPEDGGCWPPYHYSKPTPKRPDNSTADESYIGVHTDEMYGSAKFHYDVYREWSEIIERSPVEMFCVGATRNPDTQTGTHELYIWRKK